MIKQIPIVLALVVLALVASAGYWYGFAQSRPQAVVAPVATFTPPTPTIDLSGDPLEIFISRDPSYAKPSEITQKDTFWNHYKNFENGFELDIPRFVRESNVVIYEDGQKVYLSDQGLFKSIPDSDYQGTKLGTGIVLDWYNLIIYSEGKLDNLALAKKYVSTKHGASCKLTTSKNSETRNQITITDNRTTVLGEYLDGCDTGRIEVYYFYDTNSGSLWRTSDSRSEVQAVAFGSPLTWCPKGNSEAEGCLVDGAIFRSFTTFK
jgi:hypothetical protein